ncbi:MAG: OmpA family protein [Leptospirillum sp.]
MFHAENKKTEPHRIYSTTSPPSSVRPTPAPPPPPPPHPVRQKKPLPLQKDIFFAFNSHRVSYANRSVLLAYARMLKENPSLSIILYGHTDPVGGKKYNRALGFKRALAAKKILVRAGIPARRIRVFSVGKRPAAGFPECKKPSPLCYSRDRAVRIRVARRGSLSGISGIHKPKRKK